MKKWGEKMRVSVIGLGKRGVALTYRLFQAGMDVQGLEVNPQNHKDESVYDTAESDVIILGVPAGTGTCFLYQTLSRLNVKAGALLAVETSMMPGTSSHICKLLEERGLIVGEHFNFIHIPYRNEVSANVHDISPRVIGGMTVSCLSKGMDFYTRFVEQVFPVTDIRIAEMVPIIENAHRFIHASFAQEVKEYCFQNQIDFHVLRAAVNVAGHALPEVGAGIGEDLPRDMAFLQGFCPSPLFEGALAADMRYRNNLYTRVKNGQNVLVIGLFSEAEEFNLLSNPTVQLVRRLENKGCKVFVQDEHISAQELAIYGFRPPDPQVKYDVIINQGEIYRSWED